MKYKVLGVCAGNGVMIYPFKKNLLGNIEIRADFKTKNFDQWSSNFDQPLYMPLGYTGNDVDIIIGHPNCGASSILAYSRGKKLGDPKSDKTINIYFESINHYKPKFFLFENLPAIYKSISKEEFYKRFSNYRLVEHICPVSNYGNSQISRVRLVIIGIRKDLPKKWDRYFKLPKLKVEKLKTTEQLTSDLWEKQDRFICNVREDPNTVVCMEHNFKKLSLKEIKKHWNSSKYQRKKHWDASTTGKGNMGTLPGVYRNLANDLPLTARKQNRQFNPRGEIMSPRELARIQGIPDSFELWYDQNQAQYSINKARVTATKCPPYEIGWWFYKQLKKLNKDENTYSKSQ